MTVWKLSESRRGLRPLAVDKQGLLCHANGSLYRLGFDLKRPSYICNLPRLGLVGRLGNRIRLVDRIFRLTPSHATVIDNNMFISRRSEIWRCDLETGQLTRDFIIPDGRFALEFGRIEHPDGEVELIFGEYFSNPRRQPVRIWGRSSRNAQWVLKGEFSALEIEHVHAVTAIGDRVFILCGDFEHAASIWVSDRNFSSITPLLRGKQTYRAAWIRELGGRLFYATDTQLESNRICELFIESGVGTVHELTNIDGSSIYSGRGNDNQFFSTTVECGMPTGNFFMDIFETVRPGILFNEAKIMGIDLNGVCEEVFSAAKDPLPFRLAQFGTFTFPTGEMPADTIISYGVALREVDDTCLVFKK
jgi:hypothetical protein